MEVLVLYWSYKFTFNKIGLHGKCLSRYATCWNWVRRENSTGSIFKIETLLVVRFDGAVFVTDSICTHEEADLSLGMFDSGVVKCPLHGAKFKVNSGEVVSGPEEFHGKDSRSASLSSKNRK